MDLASLFSALQETQKAKTTVRLSERNVIELVTKLKQLGILGDDLLHTINGKEFLTTAKLRQEVLGALQQAGGRLSVVELPALLNVDLVHCERQAAALVAESRGEVIEAQGEIMTSQEMGQLSVADLALQYGLATDLILKTLQQHMGSVVQGRLESGLLYTPAALRRIKAQLRGALRGLAQPAPLPTITKDLGLEGFGGSGQAMVASLVEELVAHNELSGTLKGGGTGWVPASYAAAQQAALGAFYEQNNWVGYDMARKLGFSSERQHLSKTFPDGIPLETVFIHPTLLSRVQSAVEEVVAGGSWVDIAPLLPSALSHQDISALLQRVPQIASGGGGGGEGGGGKGVSGAGKGAGAAGAAAGTAARPRVVAGSCVVSGALVAALGEAVAACARSAAEKALVEKRAGPGTSAAKARNTTQASAKSAKGPSNTKGGAGGGGDSDDDDWSVGPGNKKGAKGGKGGAKGKGASGKAASGKGGSATHTQQDTSDVSSSVGVTTADIADQILQSHPDMDGAGEGSGLADALAEDLFSVAVSAWESTLAAAFTAGAESRRQAKDTLAKALEESFTRLCLYSQGIDLFAPTHTDTLGSTAADSTAARGGAGGGGGGKGGKGARASAAAGQAGANTGASTSDAVNDDGTYALLEKHTIKTTVADCVDLIFKWARVDTQAAEDEGAAAGGGAASAAARAGPLSAAERAQVLQLSQSDTVSGLQKAIEAAAAPSTKSAITTLEEASQELGLRLRRVDKKSEKAAVSHVKAELMNALALEQDPAAALTYVVPLLFIKATGRAIQLPGKAISAVLEVAARDLPADDITQVQQYHSQVVKYLRAMSGGEGAPELLESLTTQLPVMRGLVGLSE